MESFLTALGPTQPLSSMDIIFSLSISFVLGLVLATVYRWTHQSFSYARSFLHTMVLATIVITIMIMAIGNNMARGLGIMGAMAFVRFRTPIRDPRDIIYARVLHHTPDPMLMPGWEPAADPAPYAGLDLDPEAIRMGCLSMVDAVVLVCDASEGPMTQTKFVMNKVL